MTASLLLPLFYALDEDPEPETGPSPERDLLALVHTSDTAVVPGAVVPITEHPGTLAADPTNIVGAIRWNQDTDTVPMLYVQPRHRRRGVATALWQNANRVHLDRHGRQLAMSTQRTLLGEVWMRSIGHTTPLDALVMPMTPERDARGLDLRLTVPDHRPSVISDIAVRHHIPRAEIHTLCAPSFEAALRRSRRTR